MRIPDHYFDECQPTQQTEGKKNQTLRECWFTLHEAIINDDLETGKDIQVQILESFDGAVTEDELTRFVLRSVHIANYYKAVRSWALDEIQAMTKILLERGVSLEVLQAYEFFNTPNLQTHLN